MASILIFAIVGAFGLVEYFLVFCVAFGACTWALRDRVRPAMARVGLDNLAGFVLLALSVSSLEETTSYVLAGARSLVIADLPLDLLWVDVIWLGWMVPWYRWIPRRFAFDRVEALVLGGTPGVLMEVLLSGVFLRGPLGLLWVPLAWSIYSVVLIVPLSLVAFDPQLPRRGRWLPTLAVTWGGTLGLALAMFVLFSLLRWPT